MVDRMDRDKWEQISTRDFTPLHAAAGGGHSETVKRICTYHSERGIGKNLRTRSGITPLGLAVRNGHSEAVAVLLNSGASLHSKCEPELSRLAIEGGDADILNHLIAKGLRPSPGALHYAAEVGSVPCMKSLVRYFEAHPAEKSVEVMLNQTDSQGLTPLMLAANGGHEKVVEWLIRQDAWIIDWRAKSRDSKTVEQIAHSSGFAHIVGLLQIASKRANPNEAQELEAPQLEDGSPFYRGDNKTGSIPASSLKVTYGPGTICANAGPIQPSKRRVVRSAADEGEGDADY